MLAILFSCYLVVAFLFYIAMVKESTRQFKCNIIPPNYNPHNIKTHFVFILISILWLPAILLVLRDSLKGY